MRKLKLFGLCAVVCLGMATLVRPSQEGQTKSPAPKTWKQKEHGKLFKRGGRKVSDLLAAQRGDITLGADPPLQIDTGEAAPSAPLLEGAVCNADAVVVGTLAEESAFLNEDETFVFTEYRLDAAEVIRNNAAAPIKPGDSLTIVRDGGTVRLDGRAVRALTADFEPFKTGGRYVLFLRHVPATGAYLAYLYGSFELGGAEVRALGKVPRPFPRDAKEFLDETRARAAAKCARRN